GGGGGEGGGGGGAGLGGAGRGVARSVWLGGGPGGGGIDGGDVNRLCRHRRNDAVVTNGERLPSELLPQTRAPSETRSSCKRVPASALGRSAPCERRPIRLSRLFPTICSPGAPFGYFWTPEAVDIVVTILREVGGPFVVAIAGDRAHQRDLAKHIDELTGPKHQPRWYLDAQLEEERQRFDEEVSVR